MKDDDEEEVVVRVRGASKSFRIYHRRETTLKEAVIRRRRGLYEEFAAVDGVSFDVTRRQALGVIGRNGSGKSTLLKMLARILEPDEGTIDVTGRVAALLEIGAGFQPDYTAVENVYLSGAIYGVPRKQLEARMDDILAFAELERFADNPVKTYSSGMYTRLGFAIAVNVDPDILLIDEVLAVGDQSFQARCMDRMLEFRDAGKTLILVTHDLSAVESFCDRAIWLDKGRIRDDALPHHVVRNYVSAVNEDDSLRATRELETHGPVVANHTPAYPEAQVVLSAMSFRDADGREREVFHNGESMDVRIHYHAKAPIPSPVCEIGIEHHQGETVTLTSTRMAEYSVADLLPGDGYIEWHIDHLLLTPGTYYFSPRLYETSGIYIFDQHPRWYRIRVHAGRYKERNGIIVMPGSWSQAVTSALDNPARV